MTKEALELVGRKHKLVKWEDEWERGKDDTGMELSGTVGHFPELWSIPPLGLAHLPWHMTQTKQCLLPQRMAKAVSESSWTALAKGKEERLVER